MDASVCEVYWHEVVSDRQSMPVKLYLDSDASFGVSQHRRHVAAGLATAQTATTQHQRSSVSRQDYLISSMSPAKDHLSDKFVVPLLQPQPKSVLIANQHR